MSITILLADERQVMLQNLRALLEKEPEGSVFVFYCDTGKGTKERLAEFRKRFPGKHCISLRGGRGYWRKYLQVNDHADA